MLYCTVLYCTILYYTILYYTILYYTILYYTILYYTILYYTILYQTVLYQNYNTHHTIIIHHTFPHWDPYVCVETFRGPIPKPSGDVPILELATKAPLRQRGLHVGHDGSLNGPGFMQGSFKGDIEI